MCWQTIPTCCIWQSIPVHGIWHSSSVHKHLLFCASPIVCWLQVFSWWTLTPSLTQPVKFPGWMMNGHTCKQYIFRSYNICFQCCAFWWKSFHVPVRKRRPKGLRVSNFTLLWVVFKWQHGSEGVNVSLIVEGKVTGYVHKRQLLRRKVSQWSRFGPGQACLSAESEKSSPNGSVCPETLLF